jgi:hypothetical protein
MGNFIDKIFVMPIQSFGEKLIKFLPDLLSAVLILVVGFVLGLLLKAVLVRFFRTIGLDRFSRRSGVVAALQKGGIREPASLLLSKLFAGLVIISFSILAMRALKLVVIDDVLARFLLYIPNVFIAGVIILFGYILGNFLGRAVLIAAVNAGVKVSGLISRLVKVTVFLLATTMALEQLGIGSGTIVVAFAIILGGLVFAFSLAFGLGGKEIAKTYLEKRIKGDEAKDDISYL